MALNNMLISWVLVCFLLNDSGYFASGKAMIPLDGYWNGLVLNFIVSYNYVII